MDGESLRPGDAVDVWRKLRRGLGRDLHGGDLAAEDTGTERARKTTCPAGWKHVIGAGRVVAEGSGGVAAREDAASGRYAIRKQCRVLLEQLEVLGREGVGKVDGVA